MDRCKLKEELIRDEGIRFEAYQDTVGLWTIGVGHLLGTEKRMTKVTPSEAMALLEVDIDNAEDLARHLAPGAFNYNWDMRERALVNMAFNLGPRLGQFRRFLTSVNTGDWPMAAIQMMQSKWATQVGARAERLRDMVLNG